MLLNCVCKPSLFLWSWSHGQGGGAMPAPRLVGTSRRGQSTGQLRKSRAPHARFSPRGFYVLNVPIKPLDHLGLCVEDRFASLIAVGFVWQHYQTHGSAVALNGLVHSLRLHRECPAIVIRLAEDKEDRFLHLVGVNGRMYMYVCVLSLPEWAAFRLKSERRKCSVVGSAACNPGVEQIAMKEKHQTS